MTKEQPAFYNDDMCSSGHDLLFRYRTATTNQHLPRMVKTYKITADIEA